MDIKDNANVLDRVKKLENTVYECVQAINAIKKMVSVINNRQMSAESELSSIKSQVSSIRVHRA